MTKAEIIKKAELYLDDSSELSSTEMEELFDKVYDKVCAYRPWEFTKKAHTATVSGTTTSLPSDFLYLLQNYNYTDSTMEALTPHIFVGSNYTPYQVVNWSDRRQYQNQTHVAYLDMPNSNLVFPVSLSNTIEFDYHATQPVLANDESPVFPSQFHHIIYHGMVTEELMIEQVEKARSYAPENRKKFQDYLDDMSYWNSKLCVL